MPQVERIVTLTCVSNDGRRRPRRQRGVAGRAARRPCSTRPASTRPPSRCTRRASTGSPAGFPVSVAMDGRDAMIALGMNGEALPLEHGFPARLVVPGLYGYVSATKWLRKIELNRWSDAEGYWVPLGWSRDGADQDRVAHRRATLGAHARRRADEDRRRRLGPAPRRRQGRGARRRGRVARGDAGHRRHRRHVAAVVDRLGRDLGPAHPAGAGHRQDRRDADRAGRPPAPDGATGYHTRRITVG